MSAQPVVTKPDPAQTAPATARRRRGARLTGLSAYPLMYFGVIAGVLPLVTLVVIGASILFGVLFGAGEAEWVDGFSRAFGFILLFLTPPFGAWVWGYVAVGVVAFLGGIALSLRILRSHGVRRAGAVTHWGMWATVPLQLVFAVVSLLVVVGATASLRAGDASGVETVRAFGQGIAIATGVNLLVSAGLGVLIFPAVLRAVKAEKPAKAQRPGKRLRRRG
ncbi:hypothetical protein ITJ57_04280 [Plantibacter sp. VKM Ac-2880]|uniref:hypothetical protein n=1 Tax=Plantibacter sp. VKM Ac-2880 TaxID=2783827 RepID=UPI00188E896C|nr:hypothetical protein [Plantibacter sp. VKM Ac-2880]MBF4567979.1 hypothetical protein [Plantibacter sp. VKM Ac-2880]